MSTPKSHSERGASSKPMPQATGPTLGKPQWLVEELESRRLYSATPLAALETEPMPAAPPSHASSDTQFVSSQASSAESSEAAQLSPLRVEVVFVDAGVPDAQALIDQVGAADKDTRAVQVYWLDPASDGVAQISRVLDGMRNLDAVHIISHGSDGQVQLGSTSLGAQTLSNYAGLVSGWSQALGREADLMIYGCDVAASAAGQQFVQDLALLTGADVAASEDLTGDAARGGDWTLEYQAGQIDTAVALAAAWQQAAWQGLLATYTVTTTADSGAGSLRTAITSANSNGGTDTIAFNLSSGAGSYGEYTISLASLLPTITGTVILDGSTQSGYGSHPLIVIDGGDLNGSGLTLSSTADGSTIRGLVIRDFQQNGINVQSGSDNHTIVGNYIGSFNADGSDAGSGEANGGTGYSGILVNGANTLIGGTTAADRNVISGNGGRGIRIGTGSDGTTVTGNYIGTNAAGTAAIGAGAGQWGVQVEGSAVNITIGGTATGAGNVLSGHTKEGIWVTTSGSLTVQGNYIGTNAAGTAAIANGQHGMVFSGSFSGSATIGGSASGAGNVISGNTQYGVSVAGTGSVTIEGNTIGLNAAGTAALANGSGGLALSTSGSVTVGGSTTAARNVISGNTGEGIAINGSASSGGYSIIGNYIGLAADGSTLIGNSSHGITVNAGGATIGGKTAGYGNIIAGNSGDGIAVITSATPTYYYRNSIYSNTGLGIDIGNDGVTANDTNDADTGANNVNNFPVISTAVVSSGTTTVSGSLNGYNAAQTVYIEFYSSPSADASGYGEGRTYLGSLSGTTDASGYLNLATTLTGISEGEYLSAVVNVESGQTGGSEFSAAVQVIAAPVISNLSGNTLAYTEGDSATVIDQGTAASITGNNSYNGGNLTVSFAGGSTSGEDVLAIRHQGTGAGQIGVSGSNVSYAGVTIGSYTGGSSGANLVVTLNASANSSSVGALLNNITYQNTNASAPSTASRTVRFVVTDATTLSTGNVDTTVTVAAQNDAPVNTVPGAQTTNEDTALTFSVGNSNLISIADVDAASSSMQVTLGVSYGTLTLSGTTGLSFTTGDGTADASLVFTGTVANINAALAGMTYTPTSQYNGSDTLTILTSDQGNTGSGGTLTDSDSVAITVSAVNDAPVNTVPAAQSVNEEGTLTFSSGNSNLISIADVDAASGSMQVTLGVSHGTLTLSGTTGLSFTTGDGTADTALVFTGTVAHINAALAGMTYTPTGNYTGAESLTILTSDLGNTGSGGTLTDSDSVAITVNAVNDAPVNTVPGAQTTNEDTALTFSVGNSNLISIADVDAASGSMQVTLGVSNGVLTLSGTTGLSFTTGDGTADASLVFTGTVTDINAALAGMTYTPTSQYNGSDTLTILTSDQGNTGSGGTLTDSDSVAITVSAVNDAPVNSVPGAQATDEDTALTFSLGNGNLISIADVDAASGSLRVTLGVSNGVLTLSGTTGLSFTTGDGTADASLVFTGTVANINAALAGMTYTPTGNYTGADSLTILTSDLGNTGSGGTLTDSDSVAITVNAVNDAPVNTVPSAQTTNEDTALTFSVGNGNLISIADVDAASSSLRVTLGVSNGVLTLSGTTGLSFTTGDGTADASLVFTGTVADINAALAGMSYTPTSQYNGADTLTILTSDLGNTGSGGTLTDSDSVAITVSAVNDAPVNSVPGAQATDEDTALTFSLGNGNLISIADVDAASSSLQVTLGVSHGVLTLSGTTGLSFTTGDGTADAALVFTGTVADINAALAGMTYTPTGDYTGADTLTILTSDQGNTGAGGTLTDSDSVSITVNAVNDAPMASDDTATTNPGTPTDIDVKANDADVDNARANLTVTIVSNSPGTSATVNPDGTIHFDPGATNGAQTVVYYLSDPDGLTSANATLTINVAANAAPTGADDSATINEDSSYVLQTADFGFADADVGQTLAGVRIETLPAAGTLTLNGVAVSASNVISAADIAAGKLVITPASNGNGTPYTSFTFKVQDNFGGFAASANTFTLNVDAVNDAPVNTVPAAQTTNEDTALTFSVGNGNLISIADVDAASSSMQVTLGVSNGVLTLSGTTGLTFTTGDGTADAALVFSGSAADINAALAGMTYTPTGNYTGADTLTILTSDLGNTGSGGTLTDSDSVAITVSAVNDAPVNTVAGAQTTDEDTALTFSSGNGNLIAIADVDAASLGMRVTLGVSHGTLTLSGTSGLTFTTGDGTADASLVFTGTVADINAALAGMSYTPTGNYNGADTLTILTSDLGNTGSGGTLTDSDSVAITVSAVNDAPTNTVPSAQTTNEDTALTFSSGNGNLIAIADVDAASSSLRVTLGVSNGLLTLSGTTGLTFTTGDGTADAALVFTGTVADINAALAGMTYTPTGNYSGADTLTILTSDLGNTGSGGTLTDSDSVAITVSAVNDAPTNTVPGAQTTNEDTALTFSSGNGNLIAIADVDAASSSLQVTLGVSHGVLTLSGTTGLTFTTGDGTADAALVFTGTLADINAALAGMTYTPTGNYSGADTLTILTSDLGNTGSGGTLTDSDSVAITVSAVNDAPTNTVPGAQTTNEDTALTFSSGNGNLIAIADVDAASSSLQITLGVAHGSLSLSGTTGLTFSSGDGSADNIMVFTGSLADINAALAGMSYTPTPHYSGADTLSILTSDLGNTGSGGTLTDSDSVAITVSAVNDAPVNTVPPTQTINEDSTLVFSSGNGNLISFADVDAGSASMQVTLSVYDGVLTLSSSSGLSFTSGDGTADATLVFTGTVADINAALAGMSYTPNSHFNGSDTLTIFTSDLGNTGSGGTLSDFDAVTITVNAINDAPLNTVPGAQTATEDTPLTFSSGNGNLIAIADSDAGSGNLQLTLTVSHGSLTLASINGLSFSTGSGTQDAVLVFSGALADINAALAGLSYTPDAHFTGADTLTLLTSDLGNTGSGGTLTDSDAIAITVSAVNDAPVNSVPGAQTTSEDSALVFSSANGNLIAIADADAGSGTLQVSLSVAHGGLTLSSVTGLTFTTGDGLLDSSLVFTGTVAQINAALAGMSYTPDAHYNGAELLTITTSDLGNTGSGGTLSDSDTIAITVSAVNDAPLNSVPGAQSLAEDATLTFSSANGNLISIADVDAGTLQLSLSVSNGALTLSGTTGLSFSSGGGLSDSTLVFTGTLADINAALAGMSYTPNADFNGTDTLSIHSSDLGDSGSGGTLTDTASVAISVNAVNDAPVNSVPGAQTLQEDSTLVFSVSNSNLISISDPDAGGSTMQVNLGVAHGTLSLSGTNGLIFSSGDGQQDATMVFTGSVADINAALAGLIYTPNAQYSGNDTLSLITSDLGHGGMGGTLTDSDSVAITVSAVNDAPSVSSTGPLSATAQSAQSIQGAGLSISDVDASSASVQATLSVVSGSLTVSAGSTGLSISGSGSNTVIVQGSVAQINQLLAGGGGSSASYYYSGTAASSDTLTLSVDDQGNSGAGGAQTGSASVNISVSAAALAVVPPPASSTGNTDSPASSDGRSDSGPEQPDTAAPTPPTETSTETAAEQASTTASEAAGYRNADAWVMAPLGSDTALSPVGYYNSTVTAPRVYSTAFAFAVTSYHVSPSYHGESAAVAQTALQILPSVTSNLRAHFGAVDWQAGTPLSADLNPLNFDLATGAGFSTDLGLVLVVSSEAVALGATLWAGRISSILMSLLSTVPTWRSFDPLPVLARRPSPSKHSAAAGQTTLFDEEGLFDTAPMPGSAARSRLIPEVID